MAKIKHPKELKQIALSIRNVASALAPYETGNLRNTLNSYNTPDRMIKYMDNGGATFIYSVGPPGATYGKYWNSPYGSDRYNSTKKNKDGSTRKSNTYTLKKRYPKNFDYGDKALKDPAVNQSIKAYTKALGVQIANELRVSIRELLK